MVFGDISAIDAQGAEVRSGSKRERLKLSKYGPLPAVADIPNL
jgi:hypothetical protein